jgi:RNA polymerase sigma-70 factor (ECF subfamily)
VLDVLRRPQPFADDAPGAPPRAAEHADEDLLAALRAGDAAAFELLYRRQVRWLYALALRLTCRPSEAEELTQEVFVRAWQARASFASHDHFRHWLRRVLVNEWINATRRHRPLALDEEGEGATLAGRPATPGLRIDLERALAMLSPRLRAVLLLFDLHGLEHAEIAELLGMTAGASKVQLHRARRRLRELMP